MRADGRSFDQLRPCSIQPGFTRNALGSALIEAGNTRVICTASVESRPPSWLDKGGWVTAQYAMLPGATHPRGRRDPGGRGKEIMRLIGRSLRAAVALDRLVDTSGDAISIVCDCDVIDADGGTRTASITGAYVALEIAVSRLIAQGRLAASPILGQVAAVSVGIIPHEGSAVPMLDLPYVEDSAAEVDLNVVMLGTGGLVEVQGTAEGQTFSRAQLTAMLDLAEGGIDALFAVQRAAVEASR
ncbi:MAG: ribonuclease PH [Nannocystaceae bacterium]|nr:ribonuclease PH [bacterium]